MVIVKKLDQKENANHFFWKRYGDSKMEKAWIGGHEKKKLKKKIDSGYYG